MRHGGVGDSNKCFHFQMDYILDRLAQLPAESDSGFCPPKTFTEFFERYPYVVRTRLRLQWSLRRPELEDLEHELYIHLMTLPPESVFRGKGCIDRISTYDPNKRDGGNEALFIDYVHLLIDNFLRSRLRNNGLKLATTISFSDILSESSEGVGADDNEAVARLSNAFRVPFDPVKVIECKELIERASRFDSRLPLAINALVVSSSKTEAASRMKVTEKVFVRMIRHLRMLARGQQISRRRRRGRDTIRLAA